VSKTSGNVVDPLVLMDRYGTDALRFTMAGLAAPSVRDVRITEDRLEASRNFANKLWNASRLVLSNLEGYDAAAAARRPRPDLAARWIESRLAAATMDVRAALASYRFSDATSTLYQFVWSEVCDWYLEIAKLDLYRGDDAARRLATLTVDPRATRPRNSALGVVGGTELHVALEGVVDLAAERQRLEKEIRRAEEAIAFGRAKLARPEFAERAPAEIVEKEREKLVE